MARATSPRLLLAAVLALCTLLALPAASQAKRKSACANVNVAPAAENLELVRAAVLCLHNRERAARGLAKLSEHPALRTAADEHSAHMVDAPFFSHDAPGGSDMADRILGAGYARGQGWSLGENIAWGTGSLATAAEIQRAWMESPGHRANIMRPQFREIGIGVAVGVPVGSGSRHGATYTADFGVRR